MEFKHILAVSKYDKLKSIKLVNGFTCGFDLGYRGPENRCDEADNIPFKPGVGSETEMWNKIMKEVKEHRYAGPFKRVPFKNYVQSPIGLVPKAGNKTRLIFHLSFDFKTGKVQEDHRRSINYHTPKELCSVKYRDLDHAILNSLQILKQAKDGNAQIFYAKSDCSHAFRILPILVSFRIFLVLKARHPVTKIWYYFIDKCLPFGTSISCANFQEFSNALSHIVGWKIECTLHITNPALTNYLDDFLFMALKLLQCNNMVRVFLEICKAIGCPVSMEKTEWATQLLVFLGVLLNGKSLTLSIPLEKCNKAVDLLQSAVTSRKVTVKFIQKITGTLNFLNKAIVPGRAFTRGMYSQLKLLDNKGNPLKDYHHIKLDFEFMQDCLMWLSFLSNQQASGNCRPFIDYSPKDESGAKVLKFFSDVSKNPEFGFGAVFDERRWICEKWPEGFIVSENPSIEVLELYALVAALSTRETEDRIKGRIIIYCDNEAVVHMVNNLASSCPLCMKLIRMMVLGNIRNHRKIVCHHIRSVDNILSDALSCMDFTRFNKFAPATMSQYKDKVPACLWPINKFLHDKNYLFTDCR